MNRKELLRKEIGQDHSKRPDDGFDPRGEKGNGLAEGMASPVLLGDEDRFEIRIEPDGPSRLKGGGGESEDS